ncbi:MAG: thioesterase family protein [Deltaproteobacteria bacterium]|nr:thioesterase family protein [Deltaproteobacteria bacterium]
MDGRGKQEDSPFRRARALRVLGEDRYGLQLPAGWEQGRFLFGGLVIGAALGAIQHSKRSPARRIRSMTAMLCGPVTAAEAELRVRLLRAGKRVSFYQADLGEIRVACSAALAEPRDIDLPRVQPEPPAERSWQEVEPVPVAPPIGPPFARHYEYRSTGPLPFSKSDSATASGWIREQEPPVELDAPALAGMLDAWWPALYAMVDRPRATATMTFQMQIFVDPAELPVSEPLQYQARLQASCHNFFTEHRALWHAGRPVAFNQQCFSVLD